MWMAPMASWSCGQGPGGGLGAEPLLAAGAMGSRLSLLGRVGKTGSDVSTPSS